MPLKHRLTRRFHVCSKRNWRIALGVFTLCRTTPCDTVRIDPNFGRTVSYNTKIMFHVNNSLTIPIKQIVIGRGWGSKTPPRGTFPPL
jgi:hypothetical protein